MNRTNVWQIAGDVHKFVMKIEPIKPFHHLEVVRDWPNKESHALMIAGLL
jgi:hypothetical protein